jgi:hypothetical protein
VSDDQAALIRKYDKARRRYQAAPIGSEAEKEAYKEMTELASKIPSEKLPKTSNNWV